MVYFWHKHKRCSTHTTLKASRGNPASRKHHPPSHKNNIIVSNNLQKTFSLIKTKSKSNSKPCMKSSDKISSKIPKYRKRNLLKTAHHPLSINIKTILPLNYPSLWPKFKNPALSSVQSRDKILIWRTALSTQSLSAKTRYLRRKFWPYSTICKSYLKTSILKCHSWTFI